MPGLPPSLPQDRSHGNNWPTIQSWQDHARLRQRSRVLCDVGGYAEGLLSSIVSYTVADGFRYEVVSKESLPDADPSTPGHQDGDSLKKEIAACQDVVDEFLAANSWNGEEDHESDAPVGDSAEAEICRRVIRDGEAMLRYHEDGDCLAVRLVEPEQVVDPPEAHPGDGWSWGIRHRMHPFEDVQRPEEYHLAYQDLATAAAAGHAAAVGELVPARDILHIKAPGTDRSVKRGLPRFRFDTADALERAGRLQRATSLGAYIRASTAEVWKHATGTQTQLTGLAGTLRETTRTNPVSGANENVERVQPGMIRRVPAGQEPVSMPADQSVSYQAAVQGDLRQAATAFNAPEYLASGDASNANYASTREAGTPFVRFVEGLQRLLRAAFLRVVWRALRWAAERGRIRPETLKRIDVQCEAPQVAVRNDGELATVDQILIGLGVKSVKTAQMERGLVPDVEDANQLERQGQFGPPGPGLGLPGEGEGPPKPGVPTRESKDASGHEHGADGRFGHTGGGKAKGGAGGGSPAFDADNYAAIRTHAAAVAKKLTSAEKSAIEDYTSGLNELTSASLRKGEVPADRDARDIVRHLDSAFAKAPPLDSPVTAYRGLTFKDPAAAKELLSGLDGGSVTFGDYQSTSLDPEQAHKFLAGHGKGGAGVLLEIEATHGLAMEDLSASRQAKTEREFLLPRGGSYEVISKGEREVGGQTVPVYRLRQKGAARAAA